MAAQALLEECRQRQEDEIVALESIFAAQDDDIAGEARQRPTEPRVKLIQNQPVPVLEFYLPITLPRPTRVAVETYAYDTGSTLAPASSSKHPIQATGLSESPTTVSAEPSKPSPKRNNGRSQGRRSGNLNAGANAFRPGKSAVSTNGRIAQPKRTSNSTNGTTLEEALNGIDRLRIGAVEREESTLQPGPRPTSRNESIRPHLTKQLAPLAHLSPILLRVCLPPRYPAEQPPMIESLTAPWLSARQPSKDQSWILRKLDGQYQEMMGLEVLYIWATYLSESMWVSLLEEEPTADDAPAFLQHADPASEKDQVSLRFEEHLSSPEAQPLLSAQLIAHSRLCTRTTFEAASFDCAICLETRKGRACTRLFGCGHVFCSDCLSGYLSSLVDDGFHRQAKRCPDPDCVTLWSEREKQNLVDQEGNLIMTAKSHRLNGKSLSQPSKAEDEDDKAIVGLVTRSELSSILGTTRLARLDELTVKAKMEADPSVSYCPRAGCQAAVVRLPSDENSGHWERFRECLSCGFAFCAWCSRSWHGPTSCPVSFQSELIRRYLSLSPSSPDRALMEQKFGRKTLETMVRKYEEEQQTQKWLSDYTTPCPTCGIAIEKSYGCNHMTCKSCQTHYCYLCGKPISSQNPYSHFNAPGYPCYHRLFDGLLGDQAAQQQQQEAGEEQGEGAGNAGARPGFALLLDENGIPLHLEPEDQEMDFLAWQQLG